MSKSKNLLENEREQIVRLRKQSKTFTEIANIIILTCSLTSQKRLVSMLGINF